LGAFFWSDAGKRVPRATADKESLYLCGLVDVAAFECALIIADGGKQDR